MPGKDVTFILQLPSLLRTPAHPYAPLWVYPLPEKQSLVCHWQEVVWADVAILLGVYA